MHLKRLLANSCLAAVVAVPCHAAQPSYKLDVLADSSSVISGITGLSFGTVAVNDFNTVVFNARYNDGSYAGAGGIFTPNRVLLKKGDIVRGAAIDLSYLWDLNDFDELAIQLERGPNLPIVLAKFVKRGDGIAPAGKFIEVGSTIGGLTILNFRECKLNDLGELVFSADYSDSSGNTGIGVFTATRVLLKTGSEVGGIPISTSHYFGRLAGLSDTGSFAFDTHDYTANPVIENGVFTQHRQIAAAGEVFGGVPLLDVFSPAISHFDRVAFTALIAIAPNCGGYGCNTYAVFDHKGLVAKTGDTISGNTLTGVSAAGINDEGEVLMVASFAGGYGYFIQGSAVARTGDNPGGVPIEGFVNGQINDCGNVAVSTFGTVILARHKGGCGHFKK